MIYFTLLMPVSQYLDRFMEVKTTGLLVMMSMVSLSSFSPLLAYWVCFLEFLLWLGVMVYRHGYYNVFTMIWIKKKEQPLSN